MKIRNWKQPFACFQFPSQIEFWKQFLFSVHFELPNKFFSFKNRKLFLKTKNKGKKQLPNIPLYSKENNRVVTCYNHFEFENVNLRICTSMKIKIQQAKQPLRVYSMVVLPHIDFCLAWWGADAFCFQSVVYALCCNSYLCNIYFHQKRKCRTLIFFKKLKPKSKAIGTTLSMNNSVFQN